MRVLEDWQDIDSFSRQGNYSCKVCLCWYAHLRTLHGRWRGIKTLVLGLNKISQLPHRIRQVGCTSKHWRPFWTPVTGRSANARILTCATANACWCTRAHCNESSCVWDKAVLLHSGNNYPAIIFTFFHPTTSSADWDIHWYARLTSNTLTHSCTFSSFYLTVQYSTVGALAPFSGYWPALLSVSCSHTPDIWFPTDD